MWKRSRNWDGAPYEPYARPRDLREAYQKRREPPPVDLIGELAGELLLTHARGMIAAASGTPTDKAWFTNHASELLTRWGLIDSTEGDDGDRRPV